MKEGSDKMSEAARVMERIVTVRNQIERVKWVARAVAGKSDNREALRCVHVGSGFAFATDGHRLHTSNHEIFGSCAFPEGQYEIIKSNRKEIILKESGSAWSYHEGNVEKTFKNIFPDCSEFSRTELTNNDRWRTSGEAFALLMRKYLVGIIDINYFNDVFPAGESMTFYFTNETLDPVVAVNAGYVAIIMPVKI